VKSSLPGKSAKRVFALLPAHDEVSLSAGVELKASAAYEA